MPFASGHMVKGTELKRRSKEAFQERKKQRKKKQRNEERSLLVSLSLDLERGGRIQSHLVMTKQLHSGTQGRCDCPR